MIVSYLETVVTYDGHTHTHTHTHKHTHTHTHTHRRTRTHTHIGGEDMWAPEKLFPSLLMTVNVFVLSPRHHVYKKTGPKEVELKEVGPRFELKCAYSHIATRDSGLLLYLV